jgi:hypothetical protein
MFLEKDGVRIEILVAVDIARLKSAGYKEVTPEEAKPLTPEEQNAIAIAEVNKSKKTKGGEK